MSLFLTRTRFWVFLLLCFVPVAAGAQAKSAAKVVPGKKEAANRPAHSQMAAQIEAILAEPEAVRAHWAISVTTLAGRPVYGHNPGQLGTPASNTKIFTTTAAFALLGPNYRFRTTVESTAPIDAQGNITGNLMLIGRGDPNLSGRVLPFDQKTERTTPSLKALEDMADTLVKAGLKTVSGDLIADDSYFIQERYGAGWSEDDLMWDYGAPVSALSVNDNQIFLNILPGTQTGALAQYTLEPPDTYYVFDNTLTTAEAKTQQSIGIDRQPGSKVVALWGSLPIDDKGLSLGLAIEDPAEYAGIAFRRMLEARGVVIQGQTHEQHARPQDFAPPEVNPLGGPSLPIVPPVPSPTVAYLLAEHQSNPLSDDLRVINKASQNLHAELLLRTLGRHEAGSGSIEGGAAVVRKFLEDVGIPDEAFVFYDGSGVSRQNLVTPEAVTTLLCYAARQPWAAQFRDTLPLAGVDGTLSERFKHTPLQGKVQAKTGTLTGASALSGYVQTQRGRWLAFSILVDDHQIPKVRTFIDRIVTAIGQE